MCLYIKNVKYDSNVNPIPFVAKKDITCYKVLISEGGGIFRTPYIHIYVRIGKMMSTDAFGVHLSKVRNGIHAYSNKKHGVYTVNHGLAKTVLVECIIPKGTKYFIGKYSDIVALKMKLKKIIHRHGKFI